MYDSDKRHYDYQSKTREELITDLQQLHRTMVRCGDCDLASLDPSYPVINADDDVLQEVIFNSALDAIVVIDERGKILRFNRSAEQVFGYQQQEVVGREISEVIIPPELRARHAEGFRRHLETGTTRIINQRVELQAMRQGGDLFPIELTVTSFRASRQRFFTAFIRDITQRRLTEERLHKKTALIALLHRLTSLANEASNPEQAMSNFLQEVCEFTGWPVGHVYLVEAGSQRRLVSSKIWHFVDEAPFRLFRQVSEELVFLPDQGLPGRVCSSARPLWIPDTCSDPGFIRSRIVRDSPVRSGFALPVVSGTEVVGVLEFFAPQITEPDSEFLDSLAHIGTELGRVFERKQSEEMLQKLADQDPLTGLPNLRVGRDRLTTVVASARRSGGRAALLFLDLDNFKELNDTLGHDTGDRVLIEVAERILTTLRETDTVVRLGGDEFLVILSAIRSRAEAAVVMAKLTDRISQLYNYEGHEIGIASSIGVAVYPDDGLTPEELLRFADNAMYADKRGGRR